MIDFKIIISSIFHNHEQVRNAIPIEISVSSSTGCAELFGTKTFRQTFIPIHTWKSKFLKVSDDILLGVLCLKSYFHFASMIMEHIWQKVTIEICHERWTLRFELLCFNLSQVPLIMIVCVHKRICLYYWVISFITFQENPNLFIRYRGYIDAFNRAFCIKFLPNINKFVLIWDVYVDSKCWVSSDCD